MNILITGAGRGIGAEFVKQFLTKGHHVIGTVRDPQKATGLEKVVTGADAKNFQLKTVDVTNESSIQELAAGLKDLGSLDLLINNAGVMLDDKDTFETLPMDALKRTFDANTLGPMLCTRALLPLLKKAKHPRVAHITSLMGSIADNGGGRYYAYRMSKAALNMFNKSFAIDYPAVTSVVLHPGWVQTDMGGTQAPTTVTESVSGMIRVIEDLSPQKTGAFFDFRGKSLPW